MIIYKILLYILDHSYYNKYETNLMNITGTMTQKPKTNLHNMNINLMFNLESDTKITSESSCVISKINSNTYILNCELNENIEGDLQSSISFINDQEILLVNFDGGKNTMIKVNNANKLYISKSSSTDLEAGAIIAIILTCAVVLAAIIGIIIYLKHKKNNIKKAKEANDSIVSMVK